MQFHIVAVQKDTAVMLVEQKILGLGEINSELETLHVLKGTGLQFEESAHEVKGLHVAVTLVVILQLIHLVMGYGKSGHRSWVVKMVWLVVKHLVNFLQGKLKQRHKKNGMFQAQTLHNYSVLVTEYKIKASDVMSHILAYHFHRPYSHRQLTQ